MDTRFKLVEVSAIVKTSLGNYYVPVGEIKEAYFNLPQALRTVQDITVDWEEIDDVLHPIFPKPTLTTFEIPHIIEWRKKEIWVYNG